MGQVVNRKIFSILEGETRGCCRRLTDISLCSHFKLGEIKVSWNLEGRLEKRLWIQERMVWRLGLLLRGGGTSFTVKDNRSWLGGKEGETLGDVNESCLGAPWSGSESRAFDRAAKTEAGAQEHRVAELGGAWMRVEIWSLLDSRTFLSRSDGKVVGNRSDKLEGWWHGEGTKTAGGRKQLELSAC